MQRFSRLVVSAVIAASLMATGVRTSADESTTAPATREATKTYTFRGHTVTYPESWRLREKGGGAPATIYKPAGAGRLSAFWDFDRKTDRDKRTAERIRDDVLDGLAETMKEFELKEKGTLKVDEKSAAFVTFAHSHSGVPAIARHVFIPTGDGFVIVVAETALADEWETASSKLDNITQSLRFPR